MNKDCVEFMTVRDIMREYYNYALMDYSQGRDKSEKKGNSSMKDTSTLKDEVTKTVRNGGIFLILKAWKELQGC